MDILTEYAYARNVEHHFTDPRDGKAKVRRFKDGKLADVQAEINAFLDRLKNNELSEEDDENTSIQSESDPE